MKNKFLMAVIGIVMAVNMGCCTSDENEVGSVAAEEVTYDITGDFIDGGNISGVGLYFLDLKEGATGEQWWEKYQRTKTVRDYREINLLLHLDDFSGTSVCIPENQEEKCKLYAMLDEYNKEKCALVIDDYKNASGYSRDVWWTEFFTACVNGEVSITCDKVLFGEEPGTNLCPHLTLLTALKGIPSGIESPVMSRSYGEPGHAGVDDVFSMGAWVVPEYAFEFKERPQEKYEEITFHVTLPVIQEYTSFHIASIIKGKELRPRYEEHVYEADCKVLFDWDADD